MIEPSNSEDVSYAITVEGIQFSGFSRRECPRLTPVKEDREYDGVKKADLSAQVDFNGSPDRI